MKPLTMTSWNFSKVVIGEVREVDEITTFVKLVKISWSEKKIKIPLYDFVKVQKVQRPRGEYKI